jgi:hypothetical protein
VNGATEGAARPTLACRCRCYGSGRRKSREGAGFSPRRQASGEGDGIHEAKQRKIDAGGWRLKTAAVLLVQCSGKKERGGPGMESTHG